MICKFEQNGRICGQDEGNFHHRDVEANLKIYGVCMDNHYFQAEPSPAPAAEEPKCNKTWQAFNEAHSWPAQEYADATHRCKLSDAHIEDHICKCGATRLLPILENKPEPLPDNGPRVECEREPLPKGWWGWDTNGEPIKDCPYGPNGMDGDYGL